MVGAAIVGAGVLGAGAQVYGANTAASAQESANQQAIAVQQGMFNTSQQTLQPFVSTGVGAEQQISNLEGLNGSGNIMSTLESLPGYQFANTQGLKSVQNSATARGLGLSGAAQKGAASYSTGLANQYYNNLLTGLQGTANTGEAAGAGVANAATATGQGIASNLVGSGNAAAAAANATGAAGASVANSVPNALIASSLLQGIGNNASSTNQYAALAPQGIVSGAGTVGDNGLISFGGVTH